MRHGKTICKTLKTITSRLKLMKSDFFVGVDLGLLFFYAISCGLNNAPSITDYLEQGYMPYSTFDEWSMKGDIKLAQVTDSCDDRIVLVKDEDSLVHVVRVNNLTQVLTYFKKDWGWYNRVVFKEDSCVYDRYILKDTVIELQIETLSDGRVYKNMYVKTRDKCTVAWLYDNCTWSGDELPQWHAMNKRRSTVFELRKGKRSSYYLPSTSWDNPKDYYVYPAADTTVFSRSPGFETGTIKHGRKHNKVDIFEFDRVLFDDNFNPIVKYKDEDGIFLDVEVMPRCIGGEPALAHYIFQNSSSKVRETILDNGLNMHICVSSAGEVLRWKIFQSMGDKEELEKEMCRKISLKFEPATIFEQPVPCWCEIHIDANSIVAYHKSHINDHSACYGVGTDSIYFNSSAQKMPEFPGGEEELMKYLNVHIQYPPEALKNNIQGKVIVQFIVWKDGRVGKVKVVRSVDKYLDKEAVRVVKTLPKFIPGREDGEPVNVWYTLPVTFKLPQKDNKGNN